MKRNSFYPPSLLNTALLYARNTIQCLTWSVWLKCFHSSFSQWTCSSALALIPFGTIGRIGLWCGSSCFSHFRQQVGCAGFLTADHSSQTPVISPFPAKHTVICNSLCHSSAFYHLQSLSSPVLSETALRCFFLTKNHSASLFFLLLSFSQNEPFHCIQRFICSSYHSFWCKSGYCL